jgi:hypothetical protein
VDYLYQVQLTTLLEVNTKEIIELNSYIVWDLLKKKISSKINVLRPDEEFLFKFKDQPIPNYSEDHILNNVMHHNIIMFL